MERWQQFEVWTHDGGKWELVGAFQEFDPAAAMANNRSSQMRLMKVTYQGSRQVESDIIAEIGGTREAP